MKPSDTSTRASSGRATLSAMVASCAFAACSASTARAAPTVLPWPETGALRAGVSVVDITPPLGLGLYGHGFESRPAEGVRLRLRCQSFVFAQGAPSPEHLALVTCDLAAPSLALQRLVAEKVREQGVPLATQRLLIMATHTHAGPAHYFRERYYAGPFGSSVPGYDPRVEDFLARSIADGVVRAARSMTPATIEWRSGLVTGLTRNRSLAPFRANPVTPVFQREYAALGEAVNELPIDIARLEQQPSFAQFAVDPLLSVLLIRDATRPLAQSLRGVFAVFAMHPTAIANTNTMYHGDAFGFATRAVERRRRAEVPGAGDLVVGLANGAEGDVSPAWHFQSPSESRRIGDALGEHIDKLIVASDRSRQAESADERALRERREQSERPIVMRYRDLHFRSAQLFSHERDRTLCDTAELGAPAAGGAEDGPTRFRFIPEFNEGVRSTVDYGSCHGPRIPIFDVNTPTTSEGNFPEMAPISLLRLGGRYLATVPGEPTTVTGFRLRNAVIEALDPRPSPHEVVIVGLTNEYMQYFATREEFELQHYEGASTLWGPDSGDFLAEQLACLARNLGPAPVHCAHGQREAIDAPSRVGESATPASEVWPDDDVEPGEPVDAAAPRVCRARRSADWQRGVRIRWNGPAPAWVTRHDRLRVEILDDTDRSVETDDGANIEVRVVRDLGAPNRPALWEARWFMPEVEIIGRRASLNGVQLRFVIHSLRDVESVPFAFDDAFPSDDHPASDECLGDAPNTAADAGVRRSGRPRGYLVVE